ncbi:lysyl-tRNA synthetase [Candidatus Carsonella ruddii HT isolate Thao2000]|uniref:Lysyl-tRNA synthetase n=1 Tax=Candidatus Carsonella ruddii HT isolate Thao2000 TaxID=1202539 RepID=J3TWC5_CARRU|nr:amino acid--tRNA ligase-related protein [Candidatus Carsonella ruddii]AFP84165.1 lysyl-tRNA synthetase [Candidatus Carsonella ruddii HT isolate Thao2000]
MIINFKNYNLIYGKITRIKSPFIEIKDYSGKIQIYSKKKFFLGDLILVYGKIKKTKKKIFFILPLFIKLIVKNLKFKNNNFYLKKNFCIYNFFLNYFKKFFFIFANSNNFCKNESNSNSNIFKTYVFCKKKFFYLKISPEFYIKKILSNNYNRIFDITKCYRNEGCSNIHFFEFNMLEYYSTNFDFKNSIFFLEKIIKNLFLCMNKFYLEIFNFFFNNKILFKKIFLIEIIYILYLKNSFFFKKKYLFLYLLYKNYNLKNYFLSNVFFKIFDEKLKKKKKFPYFLLFFPRENSPLTKIFNLNINFLKRFELYISSIEIANGFEELNDYYIQKKNLLKKNKDFLLNLKNCINYTNGVGIGIDRLIMIVYKEKHIKKIFNE